MEEANPVKFYLARYFFLALSALQGLASALILLQFGDSPKNRFVAFALFTFALIFFSLHLLIANKIKRVALSRKKIAVINPAKVKSYDWSDVKSVKLIPFLNMYSLKLKGKRKIYFLSSTNTEAVFGLFSSESELIPKRVR
jgi:ABC-type Fe3+-siderophore transport system permease subunit